VVKRLVSFGLKDGMNLWGNQMRKTALSILLAGSVLVVGCKKQSNPTTPGGGTNPTNTFTAVSGSSTPTLSATSTLTFTLTQTSSPTSTATLPPSPTSTRTGTASFTVTQTPNWTMTATASFTPSATPSFTGTATGTSTGTPTSTPTPTQATSPISSPTEVPPVYKTSISLPYPPNALALGLDGTTLYVDELNIFATPLPMMYVERISTAGVSLGIWTGYGSTAFSTVAGIAVSPLTGNVYVLDNSAPAVYEVTTAGVPVTSWTGYNGVNFQNPLGIAVAPGGNVYVGDTDANLVDEFTDSGDPVTQWGGIVKPTRMAVSPVSPFNLYVTEHSTQVIHEYTSAGAPVTQFGGYTATAGVGGGLFQEIEYLAIATNGHLFASDGYPGGNEDFIQAFDANGVFKTQWGGPGSLPAQFNGPDGIVVTTGGDFYMADYGNSRIQVFGP